MCPEIQKEESTTAAAAVTAPAVKPKTKKAAAKVASKVKKTADPKAKAAKKGLPKVAKKATEKVNRTATKGTTPAERTVSLLRAMRQLGATSVGTARPSADLAKKAGLTKFDVYGLCYHTHSLVVDGLVKIVKMEGTRGLSYYLTAKGVKAK
jgi:hypothetical protein